MKAARITIQTVNVHVSSLSELLPIKSIGVLGTVEEFAPGAAAVSTKAWQRFQKLSLVYFGYGYVYHHYRDGAAFVRPVRAVSAGQ